MLFFQVETAHLGKEMSKKNSVLPQAGMLHRLYYSAVI